MSFTSRINGLFWSRLFRARQYYKVIHRNKIIKVVPATISFSIFTWLGFDNKRTPEDDLIESIKYAILFIQRNEYDKAERLLHVTLRQAQQIQNEHGITYIYDVMANLALQREQLDKAKSLFISVTQRLIADGATEDDLRIVHLSVKLARVSHLKKEFEIAQLGFEWCLNKLDIAMNNGATQEIKQLLAMTEDWYGRLCVDCNQKENGFDFMVKALNHMKELESIDKQHIVTQLNDLGTVCEQMNRLDESIEYIKEAIKNSQGINEMEDLGAFYVNLGKVYIRKNMLELARKNCGYGWKLGKDYNKQDIQNEANHCIKQINSLS